MIEAQISSDELKILAEKWAGLNKEVSSVVFGQEKIIEKICIGLLSNGHILLEGVPGLAKTTLIKTLAQSVGLNFNRIQFTPDLMPSDVIGTEVYNPKTLEFATRKGPIFAGVVLADEINRAPAKVQSALLEAMEEHQVTIGGQLYKLDYPFIVLATQNPIDQEGTYSLPEAQADRFMFKVHLDYPTRESEKRVVLERRSSSSVSSTLSKEDILASQKMVTKVFLDEKIVDYILDIVTATRFDSKQFANMSKWVKFGASPRASICLAQGARARAFLRKREFVIPDDVKAVAYDVMRHRLILSYEAELDGITVDWVVKTILDNVACP